MNDRTSRLTRLVPALLLIATAAAAQTIELAGPAIGTSPRVSAENVQVAGTASESLAVWSTGTALLAARVDLLGRPIDERSFTIDSDRAIQLDVATDGHDYLVAYTSCVGPNYTDCSLRFATVGPDGAVFRSRQRIRDGHVQSLAWVAGNYVLAYDVGRPANQVTASLAILDRRGFVLQDRIVLPGKPAFFITLAADDRGGVAIAWTVPFSAFFADTTLDELRRGAPLNARTLPNVYVQLDLAVSARGFIVAGSYDDMHFRRILLDRNGNVTADVIEPAENFDYYAGATASMRFVLSADFLIDYYSELRLHPLDPAGPARALVPDARGVDLYTDIAPLPDGGAVIGWRQRVHDVAQVRVVRLTPAGSVVLPPGGRMEAVNRGFVDYETPVVRRCGETFVAAWIESGDPRSVRFRRVSAAGAPLDPPSRRATSATDKDQYAVDVACTSDAALITWIESKPYTAHDFSTDARALLLTPAGDRLIELGPATDAYAAAVAGEFVVVRATKSNDHEGSHWTTAGEQRTPWTFLYNQRACDDSAHGKIATNGDELLIANGENCVVGDHLDDVIRVRPFYPRTLTSIRRPVVYQSFSYAGTVDVAASPDGWLVAWGYGSRFGRMTRIFDATDPDEGVYAGPIGIASLAWDGCAFELLGSTGITTVPFTGAATTVAADPVQRRVATDGPGPRLIVTVEDAAEGGSRVVARLAESPRCVR